MRTELGKIESVSFGRGGYQNAMIGFNFYLSSGGGHVNDFWGYWAHRSKCAKWTELDRAKALGENMVKVMDLMNSAKVSSFEKLAGVPVEITIIGSDRLESWRILKEVL